MTERDRPGTTTPTRAGVRWLKRWVPAGGVSSRAARTRGRFVAGLAMVTAGLLAFHRAVPDSAGGLGGLLEAFLPWLGLLVVVLLGPALLCRSATALVSLLLPVAAWTWLFGGLLPGRWTSDPGG